MSFETRNLAAGWEHVTVAGIADSIQYGHTASALHQTAGPRFLRITDIQNGRVDWEAVPSCSLKEGELARYRLQPDDLVFARTGATTGKSFLIRDCPDAVFASYLIRVRVSKEIDVRFLAFFCQSPDYWRQVEGGKRGVGQPNVNGTVLGRIQFQLPPLAEQHRIVAKIEELFSELDKGIENLKQARAQLTVYRQALLKHAFEGKLTAAWRQANTHKLELADQLLAAIEEKRRRIWEVAQLRRFKEAGQEPPSNWKRSYKKPVSPEVIESPTPPAGWAVTSMDALTSRITSGSRDWQQYYGSGSGTFIMAQNVRPGALDLSFRQSVNPPRDDSSCDRSMVAFNDLLVTIVGANTGDVCRVPDPLAEHYVCQSVALMRPVFTRMARFLEIYFNSKHGGQLHFRRYLYGAGRPHLSFDQLRMTPVVLPPLAEQEVMLGALEEQLSMLDHIESDISTNLQKAEALRQSILKKAFAGELVPQDPNDEPASALLARIKAQRHAPSAVAPAKAEARRTPSQPSTLHCQPPTPPTAFSGNLVVQPPNERPPCNHETSKPKRGKSYA